MTKAAGLEKAQLETMIMGNSEHSNYEKATLRIQAAETYHRMISGAYQTAAHIEAQALSLQANVAAAFSDGNRH